MTTSNEKIKNLYIAINNVVAEIGKEGQIDSRHKLTEELMHALFDIDGGEYKPELLDQAQTDAEPVAWTWWETSIVGMHPITFARVNLTKPEVQPNMLMLAPLYTHPPKQAKAITAEDVTDEMIAEIDAKDKAFDYSKIDMSSDTALRDAKKHAVVEIFNTVIDTFNGVKP